MSYFKYIKNWKNLGKMMKQAVIADLIWNGLFILLGIGLYILLKNTGLLIYLILMIKYHWYCEKEDK